MASDEKDPTKFNQFSTDNPQSDRDQIAAEKHREAEDDDAQEPWTADDMGEDPTKTAKDKMRIEMSASSENLAQLKELMVPYYDMEVADLLTYIKPERVKAEIAELKARIEQTPSNRDRIVQKFKTYLKALAAYSA